LERDLLAALKHDGARWLEELLNDPALPYKNNRPQPDEADYGQRPKAVLLTLVGSPCGELIFTAPSVKRDDFP